MNRGWGSLLFILLITAMLLPASVGAISIGEARVLPDNTHIRLPGKIVTAILGPNAFYAEEPDRSAGIRMSADTSGLVLGGVVDIDAVISTYKPDNIHPGERLLSGAVIRWPSNTPLSPIALSCKSVGGAAVQPWLPGVRNGVGTNNIGLLARIAGKVTYVTTTTWYMDDGSNIENYYSATVFPRGVLVKYPTSPIPVSVGDIVGATGVITSSIPSTWTTNQAIMLMRNYSDFCPFWSGAGITGTITGTVKDSAGAPISGVLVQTDRGAYSALSGADGKYTLPGVAAGTYSISASKTDYSPQSISNVTLKGGQTVTTNITMSFLPAAIYGSVRDSTGGGIAGATVSTDKGGYMTATDATGAYALTFMAPGTYNVMAFKGGYQGRTVNNITLAPGQNLLAEFALDTTCISPFISNGDFEQGFTGGVANGWLTWQGSWSNPITFTSDSTDQLAGSYAQKWGRSDAAKLHGGLCKSFPTIPGVTYEVIAWLRMDAAESSSWLEAGVDLTGQLASGEVASVSYTKLETQGNRKWIRYRKVIKAAGSSISFFAKFGHYNESTGPNWAYVDNVSIQPRMVLECEDYNNAYDTSSGNAGNIYRTGDVDIVQMPGGDGYAVGWTDNGEWLEWTNQTAVASDYIAVVNYAGYSDAIVHLSVDGTDMTGQVTLPKSGGWDAYRRTIISKVIPISAGNHTVRFTIDDRGCNVDSVELIPLANGPLLQSEDYTAFFDTSAGNSGRIYRSDNVDIGYDNSEGCYVGWTNGAEWLDYALQGDGRTYAAVIRYASATSGSASIQTNGTSLTGSVSLPATGGANVWKSLVTPPFTLSTGSSTLRFYIEAGGFNVNYIALVPIGDGGGGSDLLVGVHFAGAPNQTDGINDMASKRGAGQWLYSTEVYANGNREPDDPAFIQNMTDWIVGYLKPIYQAKIHPIVRIDWIWGETVPRLLPDGSVDSVSISKYARTFKKFAQLADANGVPIRTFVVANEMNLKGEATGFTNGYIPESYYVQVYDAVRTQMNSLGPGYEVLVGGMSPGTFTVDPIYTPPTPEQLYSVLSTDSLTYIDNVVKELKRRGTQNVGFSLHGYANFDANDNYTNDFMWTIRKQLEIIEREHTVTPYGQSDPVTVPGYRNAPIYITEWNRHTPQNSADGRVFQETQTSGFIRNAINQIARFNTNREVWDNVARVWRAYDHRSIQHNFHPIKGMTYFVFDSFGSWGDYSLRDWHTLSGSAGGINDMYYNYQQMIGRRDAAGH